MAKGNEIKPVAVPPSDDGSRSMFSWFLSFTSVHGLSHAGGTKFGAHRTLWLLAFVCGAITTVWNVQKVLEDYQSNDVSTFVSETRLRLPFSS